MALTRKEISAAWYRRNQKREVEKARNKRRSLEWKEYKDNWYKQNKARILATEKAKRLFMRELIDSAKSFPCADCGVQHPPYVMEFDHVRGVKIRPVANFIRFFNLDKFFAEVEKCDVVCSNCHAKRTHQRR